MTLIMISTILLKRKYWNNPRNTLSYWMLRKRNFKKEQGKFFSNQTIKNAWYCKYNDLYKIWYSEIKFWFKMIRIIKEVLNMLEILIWMSWTRVTKGKLRGFILRCWFNHHFLRFSKVFGKMGKIQNIEKFFIFFKKSWTIWLLLKITTPLETLRFCLGFA